MEPPPEREKKRTRKQFMTAHRERFHQGIGGHLIEKRAASTNENGVQYKVVRQSRLGGMLNFYVREAA